MPGDDCDLRRQTDAQPPDSRLAGQRVGRRCRDSHTDQFTDLPVGVGRHAPHAGDRTCRPSGRAAARLFVKHRRPRARPSPSCAARCCAVISACSVCSRASAISAATAGFSAAGVPGRAEYLKLKACPKPTARIRSSVASKSASVSPGKPTMKSERQQDVGPRRADALDQPQIVRRPCACGSSPSGCGPTPTAPADADRASACGSSPCAAIRSSSMSFGWLVV